MYAIVEIAGQQFKVVKDQKVYVHRLQEEEGSLVTFNKVLLIDSNGGVIVGAPAIAGAGVTAKVLRHLRGDKVIVFKKKRRKGYRKKNGHRQHLSEIKIENILASGAKVSAKDENKNEVKKADKTANNVKEVKKSDKKDDLKKIEGIGPKIAQTLNEAGILTFAELAKTKTEKISEIIAEVKGSHIPDTWAKQAEMAAQGKWDELKEWQEKLDGGVEK